MSNDTFLRAQPTWYYYKTYVHYLHLPFSKEDSSILFLSRSSYSFIFKSNFGLGLEYSSFGLELEYSSFGPRLDYSSRVSGSGFINRIFGLGLEYSSFELRREYSNFRLEFEYLLESRAQAWVLAFGSSSTIPEW